MSAAKNALYKWGLPLMILLIGAVYITSPFGASEANRSLAVSEEASENPHRHLIAPYDTSVKIALPAFYNSMADIWEPLGPKDTAFLWSIPRTGSGTFQISLWKVPDPVRGIDHKNAVSFGPNGSQISAIEL